MIHISLPGVPVILATEGMRRAKEDCEAYDASPDPDGWVWNEFEPLRSIYAAEEVKRALLAAQFNKCCYCEGKIGVTFPGDIEHYRPKKRCRQDLTSAEGSGYYWLAYSWENLFVACEKCNREYKRTQFPLANPEKRARCHRQGTHEEIPMLVHPALTEPREHIRFRKDAPVGLTPVGNTTIQVLGLASRAELVDARVKKFKHVIHLLKAYRIAKEAVDPRWFKWREEFRKGLEEERSPDSEFSAVARDLLENAL